MTVRELQNKLEDCPDSEEVLFKTNVGLATIESVYGTFVSRPHDDTEGVAVILSPESSHPHET